jgi:hypothetical protein
LNRPWRLQRPSPEQAQPRGKNAGGAANVVSKRSYRGLNPILLDLASDMLETMYHADGVGLAAQQVGMPVQLCVIDVKEIKGKPGHYRAVAYLRPHFQLDEMQVSLRLVAELPKAAS